MSATASEDVFICEVCGKIVSSRESLRRHMGRVHPSSNQSARPKKPGSSYSCILCPKKYSRMAALNRHKQTIHKDWSGLKKNFTCMLCSVKSVTKESWFDHFQSAHSIHINTEDLEFSTEEDFFKWKEGVEESTNCKFVKSTGSKNFEGNLKCYYVCHRSGYFISNSLGIRRLRVAGSVKLNGKCPAEMKVNVYTDGTYRVHYVSTHVGHEVPLCHDSAQSTELPPVCNQLVQSTKALPLCYHPGQDTVVLPIRDYSTQNNGVLPLSHLSVPRTEVSKTTNIDLEDYGATQVGHQLPLCHNSAESTQVSNTVDIDFQGTSIANHKEVDVDEFTQNTCSDGHLSLADEKKKITSMFLDVIDGMTAHEIHMAKDMVLSLDAKLGAYRSQSRKSELKKKQKKVLKTIFFPLKESNTMCPSPFSKKGNEIPSLLNIEGCGANQSFPLELCDDVIRFSGPQNSATELDAENNVALEHCYALPCRPKLNHSAPREN